MRRQKESRSGTIIVLSAVMLSMLSIIAALCMNAAYIELAKSEMRLATDAAAKAASITLGQTGDEAEARSRGKQICQKHSVAGAQLEIRDSDISFGQASLQPNGSYSFTEGTAPYNAVKVHASFVRRAGGAAALPALGQFLGREEFTLSHEAIATRIDNDICLVVDRSGSMAWDLTNEPYSYPGEQNGGSIIQKYFAKPHSTLSRWAALGDAVDAFLTVLEGNPFEPRVTLVSYSSNFNFGLYSSTVSSIDQSLTHDFNTIRDSLTARGAGPIIGNTNIAAGLSDGITALSSGTGSRPNAFRNLVLLTDGIMTQGDDPVELAALALSQNITVHTITFSDQADQVLMQQVAAAGGGEHYHAPDAEALTAIFTMLADTLPAMLIQ
jgi:Ca-activated chloride channel family protein